MIRFERTNLLRGILGGGALGAGLGVAALAIPGVRPLVAAGAIAASAVPGAMAIGAGAGAVLGTINEVLKSHEVSDEDAAYYGERMKSGCVLVTVNPSDTSVRREGSRRSFTHTAVTTLPAQGPYDEAGRGVSSLPALINPSLIECTRRLIRLSPGTSAGWKGTLAQSGDAPCGLWNRRCFDRLPEGGG
jgi:hypothetical protein